uniref:Uncharacterized protein n=1 Tax=Pipistrellus kuhlii TaxID=59472 RepID=A0A7J7QV31_PIPKU|nr:hypothetical protein mPipKuh1_008344 [Pipistrellus kuhlii]
MVNCGARPSAGGEHVAPEGTGGSFWGPWAPAARSLSCRGVPSGDHTDQPAALPPWVCDVDPRPSATETGTPGPTGTEAQPWPSWRWSVCSGHAACLPRPVVPPMTRERLSGSRGPWFPHLSCPHGPEPGILLGAGGEEAGGHGEEGRRSLLQTTLSNSKKIT